MVKFCIILLEENKVFVSKTDSVSKNLIDHVLDESLGWIAKYKPIKVLEVIESAIDNALDNCVIELMIKFYVDNVRGGKYSHLMLSSEELRQLNATISKRYFSSKCFRCGKEHSKMPTNPCLLRSFELPSIYILLLAEGKYYVGRTNTLDMRLQAHFCGVGSEWTKKYTPISVMKVYEDKSKYDEDKHTLEMMDIYGYQNVRGGCYCNVILTTVQLEDLQTKFCSANNKCYCCGSKSHYAKGCPLSRPHDINAISNGSNPLYSPIRYNSNHSNGNERMDMDVSYSDIPLPGISYKRRLDEGNSVHSNQIIPRNLNDDMESSGGNVLRRKNYSVIDALVCYRCGRSGHMRK